MKNYIDSVKKERAAYPEQNTAYFEKKSNITVNSDSLFPQQKKKALEEDNYDKMRQIRV